jgi:hydrogenase maturation protease
VIGCGTLDAGDDAAGLLAVRRARERLEAIPGVEVLEASVLDVVHLLEDVEAAVVVDTVRAPSGLREPGTIVRAEVGPGGLPTDIRSSLSSHGLGLAEAVGLAAALGPMPRVVFLGVEVADVAIGVGLSPAVSTALSPLVAEVMAEVAQLLERG